MNQGPRRISLTKKNGGKKSRETIPLKIHHVTGAGANGVFRTVWDRNCKEFQEVE
jgi:catalase